MKGSKVRTAVVREQRSEGLQPVIMPSVAAGMNFALLLLFQLLGALPLLLLRGVLFLGLALNDLPTYDQIAQQGQFQFGRQVGGK